MRGKKNMDKLDFVLKILEDKKAVNITVLDVRGKTTLCDYFVIAEGTSITHINTLSSELVFRAKKSKIKVYAIDGENSEWCVVDFGDVIVHIFSSYLRNKYKLEEIWQ